jgi:undecaprenyl-diphosphatase
MFETLKILDQKLLLFINSLHCPFMDEVMWYVSARNTWFGLYALIIVFFVLKRKKHVYITLIAVALMIVLSDQISDLIKDTVKRFRPTHDPQLSHLVHTVRNYLGGDYGFVSSHAANSFAVAGFTSFFFSKRWVTISLFCWAALVSYSRMYLGVHYPVDILGGALIGMGIGFLLGYAELAVYNKMVKR